MSINIEENEIKIEMIIEKKIPIIPISSVNGSGTGELLDMVVSKIDDVEEKSEFNIGQRSIQQSIKKSRMDYLKESKENSSKSRPYVIFGIIIVIILLLVAIEVS